MKKLYTDESFSVDAELTPEGLNAFKQIMKEISMIPPDCIVLKNKETGEEVKFVSEEKVKNVITKIEELKKHYPCFAECANTCVEIIEEGLSIEG